jgi:limonene-1,2-epoxide hydrolase
MERIDEERRNLMIGGAGLLALAGLADGAQAAAPSASEAANLKLAKDFCDSWGKPGFDPDKAMPAFIAADAHVRVIDSQPAVVGPQAVADAFRPYAQKGDRFLVEYIETFVRGPLVMLSRIDTQVSKGQPDQKFPVVGVFVIRGGKIHEWTDFVVA